MNISVFGGSKTEPGSQDYQQALEFGRGLALAGHGVLTGGYAGTMEAVSRGANEVGGRVIGVTCAEIESWRPVQPNRWLTEEVKCASLMERLTHLITACDLAVALPGGIGTLAEISLGWNLAVIGVKPMPALLLVSSGWENTLQSFFRESADYVPASDQKHLVFCTDIQQALEQVQYFSSPGSSD